MTALALSDAVLALCAVAAWLTVARARVMRAAAPALLIGWGLIAAAAVLGMLRFGGMTALEPAHRLLSTGAAGLGLPLVAAGLMLAFHRPQAPVSTGYWIVAAGLVVALLASTMAMTRVAGAAATLVLAVWMSTRAGMDAADRCMGGLAVAALLIAAGFARAGATSQALIGLHYALAAAQLAWLWLWRRRAEGLTARIQIINRGSTDICSTT